MRAGTIITTSRIFHDRTKLPMLDGRKVDQWRLSELRTKMRARGFEVDGTALKNELVEAYSAECQNQSDAKRLKDRQQAGTVDL